MIYKLSDLATYISEKINTSDIHLDKYISTENMLPNKGGIVLASALPSSNKTNSFKSGDILFSNIRTYFRKVWFATFEGGVSTDVLVIRCLNNKKIYDQYLYYQLTNDSFINFTVQTSNGAKMPRGDKSAIMEYEFDIPSLPIQKKIAHILSTLDDKIELNHKMNQTLESMAQALFKSWFVDFDPVHAKANASSDADYDQITKDLGISREIFDLFPNEFEESELGMIPKGWKWRKITEVCSRIGSGGTPKRKQEDNFNGDINWFTTKELKNNFILNSLETITKKGLSSSSAKLFPVNSVVMAIYAAPTVGRLGVLTHESSFNQAACGFVADEDNISYEFLFLYLKERNKFLNNLANGAAQQNLNVGLVKNLDVLIPHESIMGEFKTIVESIFCQIKTDTQQTTTLQKTRDTLLPKLLSGELDVSELELDHVAY